MPLYKGGGAPASPIFGPPYLRPNDTWYGNICREVACFFLGVSDTPYPSNAGPQPTASIHRDVWGGRRARMPKNTQNPTLS